MSEIDKIAGIGDKIKIKGKEYIVSPLTIADYGEISVYTKAQRLKIFQLANPDISLDEKIALMQKTATTVEVDAAITSIDGFLFQLYLQLRHRSPELTYREVVDMVDEWNYKEISEALHMAGAGQKNAAGQMPYPVTD
jgi:hypothetical protein